MMVDAFGRADELTNYGVFALFVMYGSFVLFAIFAVVALFATLYTSGLQLPF